MSLKNSLEKLKAAMRYEMPPIGTEEYMKEMAGRGNYAGRTNCCTHREDPTNDIHKVFCNGRLVAHGRIGSLGQDAIYLPRCHFPHQFQDMVSRSRQ